MRILVGEWKKHDDDICSKTFFDLSIFLLALASACQIFESKRNAFVPRIGNQPNKASSDWIKKHVGHVTCPVSISTKHLK